MKNAANASIQHFADSFARLRKEWNLYRWLAPETENARAQKLAFFAHLEKGKRYEPNLEYPAYDHRAWERDRELLRQAELPDGPMGLLLEEERRFLAHQMDMVAARGDANWFSDLSVDAFGVPSPADVEEALHGLRQTPPEGEGESIQPVQLGAMAQTHLDELGIHGWKVEIIPHLTTIMKVDSGKRLIELRGDFTFGPLDVISLLRHEIEGHIVRAENGFRLGHEFLGLGVGYETELDEGIACFLEDKHGGLVGRRYQELAARVVAVDEANRSGFWDVYCKVAECAPEIGADLTYQLTLRVKRGLADCSEPGGWTKDALYFTGLRKVRMFVKEEGEEALHEKLMAARVSWEGVGTAMELVGLQKSVPPPKDLRS